MSEKRVEAIDVFRGIAIVMVVLFHYTSRLPPEALGITGDPPVPVSFGWIGVYFFFVLSGYCIFLTLERSATVSLFLARRFSRIYPAFLAAVLLLFAFQFVGHLPSVPEAHYRAVAPGLVDVALNLMFLGEMGEWVNGSFWSIAAEVKFYALIAILALLIADRVRLSIVFTWLSIGMALVWASALWLQGGSTDPMSAQSLLKFLTIGPYLPFFALGILGRQRMLGATWTGPYAIVTTLISANVIWLMTYSSGASSDLVAPTLDAGVFLLLTGLFWWFVSGRHVPQVPLLSPVLARIGFISYSWYLIHETLGYSILLALDPVMPAYVALALSIASTLALAWGFSAIFEWRFRKAAEGAALAVFEAPARFFGRQPAV